MEWKHFASYPKGSTLMCSADINTGLRRYDLILFSHWCFQSLTELIYGKPFFITILFNLLSFNFLNVLIDGVQARTIGKIKGDPSSF